MGELQIRKRKRVCSFQHSIIVMVNFYQEYLAYLLPALLETSKLRSYHEKKDNEVLKIVRFEVDMALVASTATAGFTWSHALRQKLRNDIATTSSRGFLRTHERNSRFSNWLSPSISRTLIPASSNTNGSKRRRILPKKKTRTRRGMKAAGDFGSQVQTLRTILPGGEDMSFSELLSEVKSYVICLELQVSILSSLLDHQ